VSDSLQLNFESLFLFILQRAMMVKKEVNPFTASCENAMSLSVPGVPPPCEKFPHSSQLNFE
jgi:hypothetical protein